MAKISTKTFNPMAGVSLPGWALQSYKATAGDLSDVVDSLTSAYNLQQKREADMAFDVAKLNQQESQFNEQMEFSKLSDAKDRDFADRQARRQREEYKYKMSLEEDKIVASARKDRYDRGVTTLEAIIGDSTPADFTMLEPALKNFNTGGNVDLNNLKNAYYDRYVTKGQEDYEDRRGITSNLIYKDNFENLSEEQQTEVNIFARQTYDPVNRDQWSEIMLGRYLPGMTEPFKEAFKGQIAGMEKQLAGAFLLEGDERTTAVNNIMAGMNNLAAAQLNFAPLSDKSRYDVEVTGDKIYTASINVPGGDGKLIVDTRDTYMEGGIKYYNMKTEAGEDITLPANEVEDWIPNTIDFPGGLDKTKPSEPGWWDDTKDFVGAAADKFLPQYDPYKGTAREGQEVKSWSDVFGEGWEAFAEFATGDTPLLPAGGGGQAVSDLLAAADKMGVALPQEAADIAQSPFILAENVRLRQDSKVQEMVSQGMNIADAINQRKTEIRKGSEGVYYSDVGGGIEAQVGEEIPKYAKKQRLVEEGNLFLEDISDEGLRRLPDKMINPEWVENRALEIESKIPKVISNIDNLVSEYDNVKKQWDDSRKRKLGQYPTTDVPGLSKKYRTAGAAMSSKERELNSIKKELIQYRKEIKDVKKYKVKGVYNVSVSNVDRVIKEINKYQSMLSGKRLAKKRAPKIAKEVAVANRKMKKEQEDLFGSYIRSFGGDTGYRAGGFPDRTQYDY